MGRKDLIGKVVSTSGNHLDLDVLVGGQIRNYDSVFVKDRRTGFLGLTPEDERSCKIALDAGADFIAPSFVASTDSPTQVHRLLDRDPCSAPPRVISKIESLAGGERIDAIAAVSDGIMVGRDDFSRQVLMENVDDLVSDYIRRFSGSDVLVMAASSYFFTVSQSGKRSENETKVLQKLTNSGLQMIVSNETAFSVHYRPIVCAAIAGGFR